MTITIAGLLLGVPFIFYHIKTKQQRKSNRVLEARVKERTAELHEEIKERKKSEESACKANAVKSEFIANMNHELRTPLSTIIGATRLIQRSSLSKQQQEYISAIQVAAHTLLSIINRILDFSKIEAEQLKLERADLNLQAIIDTIKTLTSVQAQEKGITLTTNIDADPLNDLQGDPARLTQILLNLANNAVKFTQQGSVDITVRQQDENVSQRLLYFSIRDSGIGITAKDTTRIFEPFSQVSSQYNRSYRGTGLGLNISQQLVRLMGGEIQLASTLGEGSLFYFSLWLDKVTSGVKTNIYAFPPDDTLRQLPALADKAILLVEDDPLNRTISKRLLEAHGVKVRVASNARQTINALHDALPDLIFMDLQMPEIDGYETVRMIRETPGWENLHIICLTAHTDLAEKEKALSSGMNDYLTKPLDPETLQTLLVRWLAPEEADNSLQQISSTLKNLCDDLGKEATHDLLIESHHYLTHARKTLIGHLQNKDWDKAGLVAHNLYGSSNLYASRTLQRLLKKIDAGIITEQTVDQVILELQTQFAIVLTQMKEVLEV